MSVAGDQKVARTGAALEKRVTEMESKIPRNVRC